ncbi:MAG: restriction endonuclease subunit S [Acinetobacter towneri]|nr:restriction endonuclease subunit S [Acinetobacter towneri]
MYGGFNQIGRTGLLSADATCNQALSAIYPNDKVEPYFLLTYLNLKVDSWKELAASSRKDPNITKNDVLSFPLIYPSYDEQMKISKLFKQLDETINLQQQQLQTVKNLKQAFLEKMFV